MYELFLMETKLHYSLPPRFADHLLSWFLQLQLRKYYVPSPGAVLIDQTGLHLGLVRRHEERLVLRVVRLYER